MGALEVDSFERTFSNKRGYWALGGLTIGFLIIGGQAVYQAIQIWSENPGFGQATLQALIAGGILIGVQHFLLLQSYSTTVKINKSVD